MKIEKIPLAPASSLDQVATIIRGHEFDEREFVALSVNDGVNVCTFRLTPDAIPPHPVVLLPFTQLPDDPALQLLWTGAVHVGSADVQAHAYRRQATAPIATTAAAPVAAGAEPPVDDGG